MKSPDRVVNRHRPLRAGELKQRFRRLRAVVPLLHEEDIGEEIQREPETDAYWDPWQANRVQFGDWKIGRTWEELIGGAAGTIGEQVPYVDWARLPVAASESVAWKPRAPQCRWPVTQLPSKLRESFSTLVRTHEIPLSPKSALAGKDLAPFRWIAENYGAASCPELPPSMAGLVVALCLEPFWVREPADFEVKMGSMRRTIEDLMEHLFAVHPIPPCLRNAWFARYDDDVPDLRWIGWFILAGQGASIQRAGSTFGWKASRALLQHLSAAPGDLSPTDGFIWADIKRLGGNDTEFRRLRRHPEFAYCPVWMDRNPLVLPDPQPHGFTDFLADTVRWLAKHRDVLTDAMCELILPWAAYLHRIQMHAEHFSWKGRSPARAHEMAVEYRRELDLPYPDLQWSGKGWDHYWTTNMEGAWSVRELVSARELYEEGQAMSHCVSSYATRCYHGKTAIFSLRRAGRRRLSFEVNPEDRSLVQARGSGNRMPTPQEVTRLREWQRWKLTRTKSVEENPRPL